MIFWILTIIFGIWRIYLELIGLLTLLIAVVHLYDKQLHYGFFEFLYHSMRIHINMFKDAWNDHKSHKNHRL